jgi:large subunit ribosomal protein L30e
MNRGMRKGRGIGEIERENKVEKTIKIDKKDMDRELRATVKTGKVLIGTKETIKAIRRKEAGIVINSSNCPAEMLKRIKDVSGDASNGDTKVIVYQYPANSKELGLTCGKPYSVSSLCIVNVGDSKIYNLLSSIKVGYR